MQPHCCTKLQTTIAAVLIIIFRRLLVSQFFAYKYLLLTTRNRSTNKNKYNRASSRTFYGKRDVFEKIINRKKDFHLWNVHLVSFARRDINSLISIGKISRFNDAKEATCRPYWYAPDITNGDARAPLPACLRDEDSTLVSRVRTGEGSMVVAVTSERDKM